MQPPAGSLRYLIALQRNDGQLTAIYIALEGSASDFIAGCRSSEPLGGIVQCRRAILLARRDRRKPICALHPLSTLSTLGTLRYVSSRPLVHAGHLRCCLDSTCKRSQKRLILTPLTPLYTHAVLSCSCSYSMRTRGMIARASGAADSRRRFG
jgi:hypothetical protein